VEKVHASAKLPEHDPGDVSGQQYGTVDPHWQAARSLPVQSGNVFGSVHSLALSWAYTSI